MATGTVKWFAQALLDLGEEVHDLSSDTFKLGLVTDVTVPTLSMAVPHWGGTGTTDFSTNQVGTGGTEYTGPITLASVTWTLVSNVPTFRADNVVVLEDAAGPADIAYGIIYNDTIASKKAIGYIEISSAGTGGITAGDLTIDWAGASGDILTITQA